MSLVVDATGSNTASSANVPLPLASPPGQVPSTSAADGADRAAAAGDKRTNGAGTTPSTNGASHGVHATNGVAATVSVSSGAGAGAGAGSSGSSRRLIASDGVAVRGGRGSVNGSEDGAEEEEDVDDDSGGKRRKSRRLSITDSLEHMKVSHQNQRLPGHHAVFVSDMSGFTRITRKMGITHFASLILRMRSIVWPLLTAFGAECIQPHADNFYALFKSVDAAVRCAAAISTAITEHNAPIDDVDYRVNLSGMGIAWGDDIRDLGHTLHGVAVQEAFVLGEDVSDGGEVLISTSAYEELQRSGTGDLVLKARTEPHPQAGAVKGIPDTLDFYEVVNSRSVGEKVETQEFVVGDPQGHRFFELAMKRLTSPKERPAIDAMIERDFIHHRIALMFGSHGEEALTKSRGIDYSLDIQRTKHQLVMPIFKANNGYIAESCLVFFNTVEDAFLAAIQLRAAVHKYNRNHRGDEIPVDCIGLHMGPVLLVPGTDIHWGDPVNTASKLAEDIGRDHLVLLSEPVHDAMVALPQVKQELAAGRVKYSHRQEMISGVLLDIYDLDIGRGAQEARNVRVLSKLLRKVGRKIQSMGRMVRQATMRRGMGGRQGKSLPELSTTHEHDEDRVASAVPARLRDVGRGASVRSGDSSGNANVVTGSEVHDNKSLRGLLTPRTPPRTDGGRVHNFSGVVTASELQVPAPTPPAALSVGASAGSVAVPAATAGQAQAAAAQTAERTGDTSALAGSSHGGKAWVRQTAPVTPGNNNATAPLAKRSLDAGADPLVHEHVSNASSVAANGYPAPSTPVPASGQGLPPLDAPSAPGQAWGSPQRAPSSRSGAGRACCAVQ